MFISRKNCDILRQNYELINKQTNVPLDRYDFLCPFGDTALQLYLALEYSAFSVSGEG